MINVRAAALLGYGARAMVSLCVIAPAVTPVTPVAKRSPDFAPRPYQQLGPDRRRMRQQEEEALILLLLGVTQ